MAFNHYAKIKRILERTPNGWYIKKIDIPTEVVNFKGEKVQYPYYYRIYTKTHEVIPYCKFQQIERLAQVLQVPVEALPVLLE